MKKAWKEFIKKCPAFVRDPVIFLEGWMAAEKHTRESIRVLTEAVQTLQKIELKRQKEEYVYDTRGRNPIKKEDLN